MKVALAQCQSALESAQLQTEFSTIHISSKEQVITRTYFIQREI
jgi:hypothetical protein